MSDSFPNDAFLKLSDSIAERAAWLSIQSQMLLGGMLFRRNWNLEPWTHSSDAKLIEICAARLGQRTLN